MTPNSSAKSRARSGLPVRWRSFRTPCARSRTATRARAVSGGRTASAATARAARAERERIAAEELGTRLAGTRVQIGARAGEAGKLFGSVTSSDIADAIRTVAGVEIDRHDIVLGEPLKELGEHEVAVRLHGDVQAAVVVDVVAE